MGLAINNQESVFDSSQDCWVTTAPIIRHDGVCGKRALVVKAAANEVALLDIDGTPMRDAVPKSMAVGTLLLPEGLDEPTAFGGGDHARRVRGAGHAARVLVVLVEYATMPSA